MSSSFRRRQVAFQLPGDVSIACWKLCGFSRISLWFLSQELLSFSFPCLRIPCLFLLLPPQWGQNPALHLTWPQRRFCSLETSENKSKGEEWEMCDQHFPPCSWPISTTNQVSITFPNHNTLCSTQCQAPKCPGESEVWLSSKCKWMSSQSFLYLNTLKSPLLDLNKKEKSENTGEKGRGCFNLSFVSLLLL